MTKNRNKNIIITALLALLILGMVAGTASAVTDTNSSDGKAIISAWETDVVIANGTHNLTIGFNTLNTSAVNDSIWRWNINITTPTNENYQWIDIQVWNGTEFTTASGGNNTTFLANTFNVRSFLCYTFIPTNNKHINISANLKYTQIHRKKQSGHEG